MSYISHADYHTTDSGTYRVNARKSGLYTHQLKQIIGQVDAMLNHHSRVLIFRFDLHQPDYTDNNERISRLIRKLRKRLKAKYKLTHIGFTWVREIEKAKSQHYHFALMIDGNKVQHPQAAFEITREIWEWEDGTLRIPDNSFYLIHRDDWQTKHDAIYRLSYLAKGRGKGYKAPQAKNYGNSRIKPKSE